MHISLFGCIFGCQFSNTPNYEYQKKHHFRTGKPEEKRGANHRECAYPYACDIRKPAYRVYNSIDVRTAMFKDKNSNIAIAFEDFMDDQNFTDVVFSLKANPEITNVIHKAYLFQLKTS